MSPPHGPGPGRRRRVAGIPFARLEPVDGRQELRAVVGEVLGVAGVYVKTTAATSDGPRPSTTYRAVPRVARMMSSSSKGTLKSSSTITNTRPSPSRSTRSLAQTSRAHVSHARRQDGVVLAGPISVTATIRCGLPSSVTVKSSAVRPAHRAPVLVDHGDVESDDVDIRAKHRRRLIRRRLRAPSATARPPAMANMEMARTFIVMSHSSCPRPKSSVSSGPHDPSTPRPHDFLIRRPPAADVEHRAGRERVLFGRRATSPSTRARRSRGTGRAESSTA